MTPRLPGAARLDLAGVALLGLGVYVPRYRRAGETLARAFGSRARAGERAVANHDEDALTMAAAAALDALEGFPGRVDAVYFHLYLCKPIPARQALEWGLANRVVPYAELDRAVDEMCQEILDKFPECMRFTKVQANFLKEFLWNQTYPAARDWLALHVSSPETREGMTAFVEKRKPDYRRLRRIRPFQRCGQCGAAGLSPDFRYCGHCGSELARPKGAEA